MMARGSCTFRKCDAVRLIEPAKAAGMTPQRIWTQSGKDGTRLVLGFATDKEHSSEREAENDAVEIDTWEDVV